MLNILKAVLIDFGPLGGRKILKQADKYTNFNISQFIESL